MALQGTCRDVSDVAVIDLSGKITLGEGSSMIRRMIRELIDKGHRKIVPHRILRKWDYIDDSAGIGEMVGAYTMVARRERRTEAGIRPRYQARPRPYADNKAADCFRRFE